MPSSRKTMACLLRGTLWNAYFEEHYGMPTSRNTMPCLLHGAVWGVDTADLTQKAWSRYHPFAVVVPNWWILACILRYFFRCCFRSLPSETSWTWSDAISASWRSREIRTYRCRFDPPARVFKRWCHPSTSLFVRIGLPNTEKSSGLHVDDDIQVRST